MSLTRRVLALLAVVAGLGLPLVAPAPSAAADTAVASRWYDAQPAGPVPRLEVLSPVEWGRQDHALVPIELRITDTDDIEALVQVVAYLDDEPPVAIPYDLQTGTHRGAVDLSQLPEGPHDLVVVARDPHGSYTSLSGSIEAYIKPRIALVGSYPHAPVTGDVHIEALATDPQTPAADLEVRVGAAQPGVSPYQIGDRTEPLEYDPETGRFVGTWDSSTVPDGAEFSAGGPAIAGWPFVVEVTDPDGLTDSDGRLVQPVNGTPDPEAPGLLPAGPRRLLDTRPASAVGSSGGAPRAGKVLRVPVPARAALGLPAGDDSAVALSVTSTEATAAGWVTVWPCGAVAPNASTVNVSWPGQTVANLLLVAPGDQREVCLYTSSPMHVVVDLTGVLPAASGFTSVVPARLLDTRVLGDGGPSVSSTTPVAVAGRSGVPIGARQVALNLTVTEARWAGWVTVASCDAPDRDALFQRVSNLNVDHVGQTAANFVVADLGPSGSVCVYSSDGGHLIVDVLGWWAEGAMDTAPGPVRIHDSRTVPATRNSPPKAGSTTVVATGRAGAAGVIANVTVTGATAPGWVTVWPCDRARPHTSNLNVVYPGQTVAAAVATAVDASGALCAYLSGGGHLVVDLDGTLPGSSGGGVQASAADVSASTSVVPQAVSPPPLPWGLGHPDVEPKTPADDVFWLTPEGMDRTMVAHTFAGEHVGTIVFEDVASAHQNGTPDGSRFVDSNYQRYSADGRNEGYYPHFEWADSNEHTCDLGRQFAGQPYDAPYRLTLVDLDRKQYPIANLPQQDAGTSPWLASCSVHHDRAVILMNYGPRREVVIIRLSDGARLPTPPACQLGYNVTADGRLLIAEPVDGPITLCDLDTGAVTRTRADTPGEKYAGVGFNGDGTLMLMSRIDHCGAYHERYLVDLATDREVWSSGEAGFELPCNQGYGTEVRHYAGPGLVLQVYTLESRAAGKVYVIGRDGRPRMAFEAAQYAKTF